MPDGEWKHDALTISKKEIPVKLGKLPQANLLFYPENPRVHSVIYSGEAEPPQEVIEKRLSVMEHVKQLVQSIRANGGLTDPLIVRDGDLVVLEGNSRLAAYRLLAKADPIRWGMVKVRLLPQDIDEDIVFALLGEYHIIGRKDWAPYEQAAYLWRRQVHHKVDPSRMAAEMGISVKLVRHLIHVYGFMVEHKDTDVNRWSYYHELLKSNDVKRVRRVLPEFDQVVVKKIQDGEIPRAVDVREKVVKICRAGGKVLSTFLSQPGSLEKAYDRAVSGGADNEWVKRLKKWRDQICDPDTKRDFEEMCEGHQKKCLFELKKIRSASDHLISTMERDT